jgi:NitT/TauT family transport system permease protein
MRRIVNYIPSRGAAFALGGLPIILMSAAYLVGSAHRFAENPRDKLMPGASQMWEALVLMAAKVDLATGQYLLWSDTLVSLARLSAGLFISTVLALVIGVIVGFIPHMRATFSPALAVIGAIPPLAVLPILFIVFGLGEVSKVVLIVFGVAPLLIRHVVFKVGEIPREQIIKAQTLGASTWTMITKIVIPQVMPSLIDAVRLSLGAAWLFLISAEAIASDSGLGYRLFLVRRYMAMDIILTYVVWVTFLAFMADYGLKWLSDKIYPWSALKET